MKKVYFFVLFAYCQYYSVNAQYEGDQIFDQSLIHEIKISTDLSVDQLFDLFSGEFGSGNYTYTLANIIIDGITIDSVGIRVKGGISSLDPKRPFKIDFNEFVPGKRYDSIKKLNLHQGNMDPSYLRETLSYGLMRNAGVKTARTSFAKVFVNDSYEGIYTLVEQIDDAFLKNNFASNNGTLYKTGWTGLEIKHEVNNPIPFDEFKSIINQIPSNVMHEQLHEYVDVEAVIRFFIMQIFLNSVDGPFTVNDNYYLYFEPKANNYVYIPWDYNLSLYGFVNHTIMKPSSNFIFEKIKQNATLRDRYLTTFCQLLEYNFDESELQDLISFYQDQLSEEVINDPYINIIGDFDAAILNLRNVISQRVQSLSEEMNTDFTPCEPLVTPIGVSDIVINEIVASNDLTSGITDLAGGFADWIELHNNTSTNIPLNGYYLSNDSDFLKHWKFPDGTMIPANDYLIIWADRDIDEDGIHTDFKLNKDLGDLYLSFENGEIIDSISYENQVTNIGLARVPNGTGSFIQQATTFNATNDIIISVENIDNESVFDIWPNPAMDQTNLKIYSPKRSISRIQIINVHGMKVLDNEIQLNQGMNHISLPISQFNPGIYIVLLVEQENKKRKRWQLVVID